ncbi:MAG: hypothetical protein MPJ50_03975 [Pirellulales bacterium]|nr:hypothetical protein [Pirellulales bacterium]
MSRQRNRRGASKTRIVLMIVILVGAVAAGAFELFQWNRRNTTHAALDEFNINQKRDPNNPSKVLPIDPNKKPTSREQIHKDVFGGAAPTEVSELHKLQLKEAWTFPGVFTNYVVDVSYTLDVARLLDPDTQAILPEEEQEYVYLFDSAEVRNVSHFKGGELIAQKDFSVPPFGAETSSGDGDGGAGDTESGGGR